MAKFETPRSEVGKDACERFAEKVSERVLRKVSKVSKKRLAR